MSLVRSILRLLTVKALHDRTMADTRVVDSSIAPLENVLQSPQPIILVYTDDEIFKPDDKSLWGSQGTITMVLLLGVASATTAKVADSDETVTTFSFPHTDSAIELSLDIMERQIQHALMDPENPWAQHILDIVDSFTQWKSERGASNQEGTRFGARQIIIQMETVHDPVPGTPVEGIWPDVLATIAGDEDADFAALAPRLQAFMEGKPVAKWRTTQLQGGYTFATLKAIGEAPWTTGTITVTGPTEIEIEGMGQISEITDAEPEPVLTEDEE
mgnify:CR=1 FL=1